MRISKQTTDLISEINKYSERGIKNLNDISIMIECSQNSGEQKYFQDILFKAKYLKGLLSILNRNEQLNIDRMKLLTEFNSNLLSFKDKINELITINNDLEVNFEKDYNGNSGESANNLISLLNDLAECKKYFNSIKYKN